MKDTAGNEISDNTPISGCVGCSTTAGRNGCDKHGFRHVASPAPSKPYEEITQEDERKFYEKVFKLK